MQSKNQENKDISVEGVSSFQQTNLNGFLVQCLFKCGFIRPTPIQYHSINSFLNYPCHNIIAQSKSGTGKTLAFLTPILNDICLSKIQTKTTICLIILPTRQLSVQVHQYLKQILNSSDGVKAHLNQKEYKNTFKNLTSLLTIGGIPIEDDKKTLLTSGANIVVGTVGRIYQLFQSGYLKPHNLKYVIFDQGDKLFEIKDQHFDKILLRVQSGIKAQTLSENSKFRFLIYSATFSQNSVKKLTQKLKKTLLKSSQEVQQPKFIYIQTLNHTITNQLIQKVTQNPSELNFVTYSSYKTRDSKSGNYTQNQVQNNSNTDLINLENIKKFWVQMDNDTNSLLVRKCNKLKQILSELKFKKCLIFVQKKALLQQIYDQMKQFQPLLIHGSLSQASRIKVMNQANKVNLIISSDLLARGIDLVLDLVILYDAHMNQTFWHRIGRTGRFGRVGVVVSLDKIQQWKQYHAQQINYILKQANIDVDNKNKKQWYGTYMTQYGRWEQVNTYKEEIINKNYNFYDQNIMQSVGLGKKYKKQLKKVEKQATKQMQSKGINQPDQRMLEPKSSAHLQVKGAYSNQQHFIQQFKYLFECHHCYELMVRTGELTNYQFELKKYFKHPRSNTQTLSHQAQQQF